MKIKELSKASGIKAYTIRYYEEIGLLKPTRLESKYRIFQESDLLKLKLIKVLQYAMFDLKEIKVILESLELEASPECNEKIGIIIKSKIKMLLDHINNYQTIIKLINSVPLANNHIEYKENKTFFDEKLYMIVNDLYEKIEV
ncbi:MerR family transcriptional regulator [Haploplasma axanthum]|uniref:Copper export regulator n=1 Tax=Haploplasma axanthum TaxID=29552 RepID=A0A449BEM9_HAPAX|nr:MerR family transcriptional regulator [Haploplasma axanthum]VEU80888.1 Copper export regulator [Haploplasma axanthum]